MLLMMRTLRPHFDPLYRADDAHDARHAAAPWANDAHDARCAVAFIHVQGDACARTLLLAGQMMPNARCLAMLLWWVMRTGR